MAQATAEQTITARDEVVEELVEAMKADLRYAENAVDFDDDKLKLIGWAGRKATTALQPPGQARLLEAPRHGEGWVFLDWRAPQLMVASPVLIRSRGASVTALGGKTSLLP